MDKLNRILPEMEDYAQALACIRRATGKLVTPEEIYTSKVLETWAVQYAYTHWPTGMRLMPDIIRHAVSWKQAAKILSQGYGVTPWPAGVLVWRNGVLFGTRIINL